MFYIVAALLSLIVTQLHGSPTTEFLRLKRPFNSDSDASPTTDYVFSRKPATWDVAFKSCRNFQNSNLLSLETNEESQLLNDLINDDLLFEPTLPLGTTFWTGGAYNFKMENWEWSTSSSKKYKQFGNWTEQMWKMNEPTTPISGLDRVAFEKNNLNHSNWKALSATQDVKAFYICEF